MTRYGLRAKKLSIVLLVRQHVSTGSAACCLAERDESGGKQQRLVSDTRELIAIAFLPQPIAKLFLLVNSCAEYELVPGTDTSSMITLKVPCSCRI